MAFFDQVLKALHEECVHKPLLYSIGSSTMLGLGYFVYSGIVEKSVRIGLIPLLPIGIGGALFCMHTERMNKIRASQFKAMYKYRLLTEGTQNDNSLKTEKLNDISNQN